MSCLFILKINHLFFHLLLIFSHSEGCLFTLFVVSFLVQKLSHLIRSHVYFCFYFHYSRMWVIEDIAFIYVIECSACVFLEEFYSF